MGDVTSGRLILLCGLPGSGKTTVAKQLERELGAIRFSPDEWMTRLGIDLFDQAVRGAIEGLQWDIAQTLLRNGCTVVIEWGVWSRSERDALRATARELAVSVELRHLDAPFDVLVERVRDRVDSVPLTREHMLEYASMFEPPDDDELALYD